MSLIHMKSLWKPVRFGQDSQKTLETRLENGYRRIREEANRLAGKPDNIVNRSVLMHSLYQDSKKNFTFAELAAHGGLWFNFLFDYHNSTTAKIISFLASPIPSLKRKWNTKLRALCETLQKGNQLIFVESFSAYFFSKLFGKEPGASRFVAAPLLNELNDIHDAAKAGIPLSEEKKKQAFLECFHWEQKLADPIIKEAYDAFDIPVFKQVAINPIVHMSFIPKYRAVFYRNFTNIEERLVKGKKIYDIAVSKGWAYITQSLKRYRECPKDLELQSQRYQRELSETMAAIQDTVD